MGNDIDMSPSFAIEDAANSDPAHAEFFCDFVGAEALASHGKSLLNFCDVELCAWIS
jgi:hypothetical protein